jgi:hypothetical protein
MIRHLRSLFFCNKEDHRNFSPENELLTSKKLNNKETDLKIFSYNFVSNFLVTECSTPTLNLLQCISYSRKIIYSVAFKPGKWASVESC